MADDMEKMREVISEHAITLGVIVKSFTHIEGFMKESLEVQKEQAVFMERMANHEEKNSGEHKHLHIRIDELKKQIEGQVKHCSNTCSIIEPLAKNGDRAYKIFVWAGAIIGGIMLVAFMIKTYGIGK